MAQVIPPLQTLLDAVMRESKSFENMMLDPKEEEVSCSPLQTKEKLEAENAEEQDDVIDCICGDMNDTGFMIQCDTCNTWLHGRCVNITRSKIPKKYFCPRCEPQSKANKKRTAKLAKEEQDWEDESVIKKVVKGETLEAIDEYDNNDNEKSYRWPKLFIEALTSLGGSGTRVEIVNWLEEHFGAYLKTKPNWRGNLTNLNKQGFLNKYWTREEIGISENGRTKYLYRIVGDKNAKSPVKKVATTTTTAVKSEQEAVAPVNHTGNTPDRINVTWTDVIREALSVLGSARADEIADWIEVHYLEFVKKKGENWKSGPLRSGINNSLGVHWISETDPSTKRKLYKLIEEEKSKAKKRVISDSLSPLKKVKSTSDSDSDNEDRAARYFDSEGSDQDSTGLHASSSSDELTIEKRNKSTVIAQCCTEPKLMVVCSCCNKIVSYSVHM